MRRLELKNWLVKKDDGQFEMQTTIPNDVTNELFKNGYIPDPLFATNMDNAQWIAESDWVYTSSFDVPNDIFESKRINLCFDGIDTLAKIYLNDEFLGNANNMFNAFIFDVKPLLKKTNNFLKVVFSSSTNYIKEKNDGVNYRSLFTQDRIFIRKAQCHWGWDWAPELVGIGMYLPAYIEADDGLRIDNIQIKTFNNGDVIFSVTVDNGSYRIDESEKYFLNVKVDDVVINAPVKYVKNNLACKIDNPKLWFPNGYGEQNLYSYSVELIENNKVLETKTGRFAFRNIEIRQKPISQDVIDFAVYVNDKRIFCKGSNWVPISNMTGAIPNESYKKLLSFAKEANFNLLRVWGGGFYEKEVFYDICDELGILVWQDFMFSCSAIPTQIDGMEELIIPEVIYQIKRLRNHPSIALWCGGNEYMPHLKGSFYEKGNKFVRITLRGICCEYDSARPYIHNSPSGCGDDEWDTFSGDSHISCMDDALNKNDVTNYRKFIFSKPACFVSESAILGCTRLKSLRKFIPENELKETTPTWDYHFVENPYGVIPETFVQKEKRLAKALYGNFDTIEDFVKYSMLSHAEILSAEIDFARANKNCAGFMNWMYNDNWGCGTWSVVDYYFERKPAYYAMKRSFEKLRINFTEDFNDCFVNVINDGVDKTINGKLLVQGKTFDGQVLSSNNYDVKISEGTVLNQRIEFSKNSDYVVATFSDEHISTKEYMIINRDVKVYQSDFSFKISQNNANYTLTIQANSFLRSVFIDVEDSVNLNFSDNFFNMEKGEIREICISSRNKSNFDINSFKILTIADTWNE